jgi:hypothetical protein
MTAVTIDTSEASLELTQLSAEGQTNMKEASTQD